MLVNMSDGGIIVFNFQYDIKESLPKEIAIYHELYVWEIALWDNIYPWYYIL